MIIASELSNFQLIDIVVTLKDLLFFSLVFILESWQQYSSFWFWLSLNNMLNVISLFLLEIKEITTFFLEKNMYICICILYVCVYFQLEYLDYKLHLFECKIDNKQYNLVCMKITLNISCSFQAHSQICLNKGTI